MSHHVERTLPPIEQLEVVVKATRVLDEVKRAHDELEVESALLERKHQRSGLGKHFSHSQSMTTVVSDVKDMEKDTEDVLVHRPLGQIKKEKESRKGKVKPPGKPKPDTGAVQAKRPSEEIRAHLRNNPIPAAQLNAARVTTRRGTASMAAPPTRPAPYVQSTKLTIPPPPPPPPPQLLVAPHPVPTMAPCGIHPPQTAAIPLFTPQAFPSHESPRWPHDSEASTQTCLSGTEKPGCAVTTTIGHSSEMGTQVGGGGDSAPSASKNLVVTHLPLVNITTSEEQSMTPPKQPFDEDIPSGGLQSLGGKDEHGVNQKVSPQSYSAPAIMEASQLNDEVLEEVVICGQMGPLEQLDPEHCFQVQMPGLLASVRQSGPVSLEELEQRLNEHVMSQAQQWIQQELCTQVMAKVSLPNDPTIAMEPDASSNSCSTCFLQSDHSTAHHHSNAVLHWFAHTGFPVDSQLVHKLVQQIVVEQSLALHGDSSAVDAVSHESSSEGEEFSYTPPTSRDASIVTLVPTPKPTPPPSPPTITSTQRKPRPSFDRDGFNTQSPPLPPPHRDQSSLSGYRMNWWTRLSLQRQETSPQH
eukprot:Em0019g1008a